MGSPEAHGHLSQEGGVKTGGEFMPGSKGNQRVDRITGYVEAQYRRGAVELEWDPIFSAD